MSEKNTIFVLFRESWPVNFRLLGVYTTEEAGRTALAEVAKNVHPDDEFTYLLEEWPLNELGHKFNISVIATKDGTE